MGMVRKNNVIWSFWARFSLFRTCFQIISQYIFILFPRRCRVHSVDDASATTEPQHALREQQWLPHLLNATPANQSWKQNLSHWFYQPILNKLINSLICNFNLRNKFIILFDWKNASSSIGFKIISQQFYHHLYECTNQTLWVFT